MTRWARRSLQKRDVHEASEWGEHKTEKSKDKASTSENNPPIRSRILTKDIRRENRRIKRQRRKESNRVCFHCRVPGHGMADCPKIKDSMENGCGICFKCGSAEHSSKTCTAKLKPGEEFAFGTCFVCGNSGHLSSTCPDNPRRLYPEGGSCKLCGSVEHYKKDCPERKIHNEVNVYSSHTTINGVHASLDDELTLYENVTENFSKIKKPKRKVVNF